MSLGISKQPPSRGPIAAIRTSTHLSHTSRLYITPLLTQAIHEPPATSNAVDTQHRPISDTLTASIKEPAPITYTHSRTSNFPFHLHLSHDYNRFLTMSDARLRRVNKEIKGELGIDDILYGVLELINRLRQGQDESNINRE